MKNAAAPQQLTLIPSLAPAAHTNARFVLSKETRERGIRHVAEIRQMLAERKAARDVVAAPEMRPHTGRAA